MTRVFYGPGFPANAFSEVQDVVGELLESVFGNGPESSDENDARPDPQPEVLLIDVEHFENEVIACADVPGASAEDVEIEATEDLVTVLVKGEEAGEDSVEPEFKRYERPKRVTRKRMFRVRRDFDPANIKAVLVNGVLTVTVPLKEIAKPVTVKVSTTSTEK